MSPRAAWRLERLGFTAYDYVAGKVDWMAAGLPTVRSDISLRRAIEVVDPNPATCSPSDPVGAVAPIVASQGSVLVVLQGVLLGRVRSKQLSDVHPDKPVEEVMEPGPATVRADEPLDALLERLAARNVHEIVVTTPDGHLLGIVRTAVPS